MAIYEYKCEKGHVFILFRPIMNRDKPATCRECGSPAKRNLILESSFALKGQGWSRDGYHRNGD
jgi:putative FmdB family regulatory protein